MLIIQRIHKIILYMPTECGEQVTKIDPRISHSIYKLGFLLDHLK